ncbi:MAG: bifunctional DNA-formamidopyrimidine glycosylase/DNA-(apurinic or apyrimidinic site) lyase [Patescibacteria group bacterium]
MPELPEVQTTVNGLQKVLPNLKIKDVWTDWPKTVKGNSFQKFKHEIIGEKISAVKRRAKNILINISGGKTILIHMKMTGHLLYGKYNQIPYSNVLENIGIRKNSKKTNNLRWVPADKKSPLNDPFNRFIHFVFTLSNGKHLAFSDMRKFGKLALEKTSALPHSPHLSHLGPEPLEKKFTLKKFSERLLKKPNGKIKTVLMDQVIISGIGNIYSDEMLFLAGIHPETKVSKIKINGIAKLFSAMKKVLKKGIDFGGDSMSDYRNINGERGKFQEKHNAYQKTGSRCAKRGCFGVIIKKKIGGRSAHFCSIHQKLY